MIDETPNPPFPDFVARGLAQQIILRLDAEAKRKDAKARQERFRDVVLPHLDRGTLENYLEDPWRWRQEFTSSLEKALESNPDLAQEVCKNMEWPRFFGTVFTKEQAEIASLRERRNVDPSDPYSVGLALSGGGIRSATFNLGILQELAALKILRCIDYLSTVSGGGYIGSWLIAWLKRRPFDEVEKELDPDWAKHAAQRAAPQVEFLRDYSNYLTPRLGLLGADTWTAVAIFLRNLLLNLLIFVSLFVGVLLIPYLMVLPPFLTNGRQGVLSTYSSSVVALLGAVLAVLASWCFGRGLWEIWRMPALPPAPQPMPQRVPSSPGGILASVVLPLFAAAWLLCTWLSAHPEWWTFPGLAHPNWALVAVLGLDLVVWAIAGGLRGVPKQEVSRVWLVLALVSYWIVSVAANWWILGKTFSYLNNHKGMNFNVIVWGVPLAVLVALLAGALQVGLTGLLFRNDLREWTARLGAWILIFMLGWIMLLGIAFYGPLLALWAGAWIGGTLTLAGVAHTIAGVLSAYNAKSGKDGSSNWLDILAQTAPPVFVVLLFVLLSFGIYKLFPPSISTQKSPTSLTLKVAWASESSSGSTALAAASAKPESLWQLGGRYWDSMARKFNRRWVFLAAALGAFILGVLLSRRVDVNDFSMHLFYRNRLVRCYLGASRPDQFGSDPCRRQPNRFTGFDPRDDVLLAGLAQPAKQAAGCCYWWWRLVRWLAKLPQPPEPAPPCDGQYTGPYPIINATLNLTHGERLAWQERKAESFTFTPLFCGGTQNDKEAYRPTGEYTYPGGPFLGTAFAISGAAVSPYVGFHRSPAAGFLLTVFNARLSQWLRNPSHPDWDSPGLGWGLKHILAELFGLMDDESACVCLSDGGHFENLGIYELVRRQCQYIIVGDGSEDPKMTLGDLGNAIRKCRDDFGVEIDIKKVEDLSLDPATSFSQAHFAVGTINYPGSEKKGVLVYLKPLITGKDEPADVLNYKARHPEFPHQSTADQFFDEPQFESYRRLGQLVAEKAFAAAREIPAPCADKERFFRAVQGEENHA
jgi:hypothetical protein